MLGGVIISCDGMVLKAVYGVAGFATQTRDFFSSDKLDVEFRAYRSGRSSRDLHGSQEYYFSFCPVDGWFMTDQPIVTDDDIVSFIQFCDEELCRVGFASGEGYGEVGFVLYGGW